MNDRVFSLSFLRYFRAFTHNQLLVSFRSFTFQLQNKHNQPASCYYVIKITCNNKCFTQITMSVAD